MHQRIFRPPDFILVATKNVDNIYVCAAFVKTALLASRAVLSWSNLLTLSHLFF